MSLSLPRFSQTVRLRALSVGPRHLTSTSRNYGLPTKLEERAHTRPLSLLTPAAGSEIAGEGSPNTLRFKTLLAELTETYYIPSYSLLQGKGTDYNQPKEEDA